MTNAIRNPKKATGLYQEKFPNRFHCGFVMPHQAPGVERRVWTKNFHLPKPQTWPRDVSGRTGKEHRMKKRTEKAIEQPAPFTPGLSRAMVRQHGYEMFRDKLPDHPLTLEDWVLAEKDLADCLAADNLPK